MKLHIIAGAVLASFYLAGCATSVRTTAVPVYRPAPAAQAEDADAVDLVPPVPTFTSIADCELAYGIGECGTGADIYTRAALEPPVEVRSWYMPYAYVPMTGVLVQRFFAPPAFFVPTVEYRAFVSPVVVQKYRTVTATTVATFKRAPVAVQHATLKSGPGVYSRSKGAIVSRPPITSGHASGGESPTTHVPHPTPHTPASSGPVIGRPASPPQSTTAPSHPTASTPARHEPPPSHRDSSPPPKSTPAPVAKATTVRHCNPSLPRSSTNCS